MRAIILAAGEGKKFFPYDLTRQKAAMPVANRPLIAWAVDWLAQAGVREIVVVVGYRQERVRNALRHVPDVRFVEQSGGKGTAWAVLDGLKAAEASADDLLIVYGDVLVSPEGLRNFILAFQSARPVAAALVTTVEPKQAGNWIIAHVDGDSLRGISGHARGGTHRLCGIYAFRSDAVPYIAANPGVVENVPVGGMPPMEAELAQSIQLIIDDGKDVLAVSHTGLFVDIDKPWHLLEANARMAEYLCSSIEETQTGLGANIDDGAELHGPVVLGAGSIIGRRVVINGPAIIGDNTAITNGAIVGESCVIGSRVKLRDYCLVSGRTVIEDECIVGHGAEIGGVLMRGAYLYHYCEMAGIFGMRFDAGAGTLCGTLRFDDGDTVHTVQGRRETPEYHANVAYLGDFTRTGVGAVLMPGVKVGAYSCIGPGVVLYDDVDHGSLVLVKQELVRRPWGPERYGW